MITVARPAPYCSFTTQEIPQNQSRVLSEPVSHMAVTQKRNIRGYAHDKISLPSYIPKRKITLEHNRS